MRKCCFYQRSQKMHENSLVWKGGNRWWIIHGFLRRLVVVENLTGCTAEVLDPGLFGEEKNKVIYTWACHVDNG